MATHSLLLIAVPDAELIYVTPNGFHTVDGREAAHFWLYQAFTFDPGVLLRESIAGAEDVLL